MGGSTPIGRRAAPAEVFADAGAFLCAHRLTPEPANYAIAYAAVAEPDGPIGREVLRLTDGGLRLCTADVVRLGGVAATGPQLEAARAEASNAADAAEALVARTQAQVEGFRDTVHAMSVEAQGFGRDLAAALSAHGWSQQCGAREAPQIADIALLASTMIERARLAETRLAEATREADALRAELDEARGSARRDALTGLPNRRAFDEAYAAMARDGGGALAICDIDRFKQVNDRFGHAVGDRVLKVIGAALVEGCPDCLVARYGGEEFVMLFKPEARAHEMLETARIRIAERRLRLRETEQPLGAITFSAGLTTVAAGEPLENALARADRALYAAKAAGRNCTREAPRIGA